MHLTSSEIVPRQFLDNLIEITGSTPDLAIARAIGERTDTLGLKLTVPNRLGWKECGYDIETTSFNIERTPPSIHELPEKILYVVACLKVLERSLTWMVSIAVIPWQVNEWHHRLTAISI